MARKEDDDEEYVVNTSGAVRYPCMPSEVALQQMRNRMQLARLGKKLMKWTALATSREMRQLTLELDAVYEEFNEKMHDAFIMLARSRYFNPHLNNVVTENVETNAAVLVESRIRAKSGVKVMLQEMKETGENPYTYLGMAKGGETITEAKKHWLEVIRMLMTITQLRATFLTVEKANKAANKKKNVFTRIIIPRTLETIAYIESGLEELAREDFFRLRRFIYKKRSAQAGNQETKPIEIKERLIPKVSKRMYKIECFMCGAFLGFSLINEREKFLERRKVDELRSQMNEVLQIAKKLEEQGIVDVNVDEFILTAEKLKEKLHESPHIDQLCRVCKELLKRKHEKEIKKQEELQTEKNVIKESITSRNEAFIPEIAKTIEKKVRDKPKMIDIKTTFDTFTCAPTQDLNLKEAPNDSIKISDGHAPHEPKYSKKITDTFGDIYQDTEKGFHPLEHSAESVRNKISSITITKELKSDPSILSQFVSDSPLETSIEKIKRVVTDEKENKLFVEEKIIITIKEKIKDEIGKKSTPSQTFETSLDKIHNPARHEITQSTKIEIGSHLFEPISSESIKRESMHNSSIHDARPEKDDTGMVPLTKDLIVKGVVENVKQSNESNVESDLQSKISKTGPNDLALHSTVKSALHDDFKIKEEQPVSSTSPILFGETSQTNDAKQMLSNFIPEPRTEKQFVVDKQYKILTPPPSLSSLENVLQQVAPETEDGENDPNLVFKYKPIETIPSGSTPPVSKQLEQKEQDLVNSSAPKILETDINTYPFTDTAVPDEIMKEKLKNKNMKGSTSMPYLYIALDEPEKQTMTTQDDNFIDNSDIKKGEEIEHDFNLNRGITIQEREEIESEEQSHFPYSEVQQSASHQPSENSQMSDKPKTSQNDKDVYTTYTKIKISDSKEEPNKTSISIETSKSHPEKRVRIIDIKETNSLPIIDRTSGLTPRGSISYAGMSGVYIPAQNPREIMSEPCLSVSSTTLLSTELDTTRD